MKQHELISMVSTQTGLKREDVKKVIEALCHTINRSCIRYGVEVNFPNFGKFKQKVNPSRKGINPFNKQPMDIPESRTIKFVPSPTIKEVDDKK